MTATALPGAEPAAGGAVQDQLEGLPVAPGPLRDHVGDDASVVIGVEAGGPSRPPERDRSPGAARSPG